MEALSQLDIQSPDHVSVITRDGKMTVSIIKDGAAVTVSMPIRTVLNTNPPVPLQQDQGGTNSYKVIKTVDSTRTKPIGAIGTKHFRYGGPTPKLTVEQVKEIKSILADGEIMAKFKNITHAYKEIGKAYQVTGCAISQIARGITWNYVNI